MFVLTTHPVLYEECKNANKKWLFSAFSVPRTMQPPEENIHGK